jgi:hypothetical protein
MGATPLVAPYAGQFNFRRHRVDRISLFVRNRHGDYVRQSGNDATYVASQTSTDAWIQYGFLKIANDPPAGQVAWTSFAWPKVPAGFTAPANTVSEFASEWILGRSQILLQTRNLAPGYWNALGAGAGAAPGPSMNRPASYGGGPWTIQDSRYDVVNTTMEQFYDALDQYLDLPTEPGPPYWWTPETANSFNYTRAAKPFTYRTDQANAAKPVAEMSTEMALATPIFMKGVTQFIVEFAGDFYVQPTPDGTPERVGTLDWDEIPAAAGGGSRIHWYGFPRDVDGDGVMDVNTIFAQPGLLTPGGTPTGVRWKNPWTATAIEPYSPTAPPPMIEHPPVAPQTNYIWAWGPMGDRDVPTNQVLGPGNIVITAAKQGHPYTIRPRLIRITMEVTDANGRLADGQRMEMIFRLPDLVRKY